MPSADDFVPSPAAFAHRFTVQLDDIDELGHAGNVTWVRWVNDAAIAHSASVGLGADVYRQIGVLWVVRKHEIEYLASALVGQTLVAATWVADIRGATSQRRTLFSRADAILVRASTTWALIDATTGRPRRVPKDLMARYGFGPGGS
jgi:acyl-CoA thioester hydrolase